MVTSFRKKDRPHKAPKSVSYQVINAPRHIHISPVEGSADLRSPRRRGRGRRNWGRRLPPETGSQGGSAPPEKEPDRL